MSLRSNMPNTRDSVSSGYAKKRVEKTTHSREFLTQFEVFG